MTVAPLRNAGSSLGPFTLGTAQFGGVYGIANRTGCPDDTELRSILETAASAGIILLDTARAYGSAEERLGKMLELGRSQWRVVTKIRPISEGDAAQEVDQSIEQSLAALATDYLDIVMFHRAADLHRPMAIKALREHRAAGRVGEIGVSVYTPEEAIASLQFPDVRHLQIPFNILDGRWLSTAFVAELRRRPDLAVHARSAFLQGLLLQPPEDWPDWVPDRQGVGQEIDRLASDLRGGRIELCLRYSWSFNWIATTVIGVETAAQLRVILGCRLGTPLDEARIESLAALANRVPSRLLNPAAW